MSDDLLKRLREEPDLLERCRLWLSQWEGMERPRRTIAMELVKEAADEIERLRAKQNRTENEIVRDAQAEIERLRAGLREIEGAYRGGEETMPYNTVNKMHNIARRLLGEEK